MIARIYKCFIASPSDTQVERDACDVVFEEINSTLGEKFGFRIESVRWENDASPGFGKDGQDVINKQLRPGEHDFFVGIMWCRFGSPTLRAESGTEEEFNQAYEKWNKCNTQRIQFYFNTAEVNVNDIDIQQLDKVRKFKEGVSSKGGLYTEYGDLNAFKVKLRCNIERELLETCKSVSSSNVGVHKMLGDRLAKALSMFSNQPVTWIERILCKDGRVTSSYDIPKDRVISVGNIIDSKDSCVIKAPPQFGLTCLAHHMIIDAWQRMHQTWIYIDFDEVSPKNVCAKVAQECNAFGLDKADCILVDSWSCEKNGAQKILEVLHGEFSDTRLVIMQTVNEEINALESVKIRVDRNFAAYNLLALPRCEVRKAVKTYVARIVDDENTILNKLILDFEALNIHRTPMNCWTLLKGRFRV